MKKDDIDRLESHLARIIDSAGRSTDERKLFARLMCLFADLPKPADPFGLFPHYDAYKDRFLETARGRDGDAVEEAFLTLYSHVHGHEAPYTEAERTRVDETGGYWCHAGGISPILKAAPFIGPDTVSGDFGAGNGLQSLLFQKLYPHKKAVLIEISSKMVEAGKHLQEWLGIPRDRVEWVVGDVLDASPRGIDFIYLYRPVRPEGTGRIFYEKFAADLAGTDDRVVIFSIADCLRSFLPETFEMFYTDGHLTCYRRGATPPV
jgi:hypothetical protein